MENKTYEIKGIIKTVSPIVHSEVLSKSEAAKKESDDKKAFRTLPFMAENADGKFDFKPMYAISGNSIRGIGRRLMYHHTFEDLFDMDLDTFFAENVVNEEGKPLSNKDKRNLMSIFMVGGVSPEGARKSGSVPAGIYDEVINDIPMLGLLGAVYMSYHFDSSCSIGHAMLRCNETAKAYQDIFHDDPKEFTTLDEFKKNTQIVNHTKTQPGKDDAEFPSSTTEGKNTDNKSAMIYGMEVLPIGTSFYWRSFCNTNNDRIRIAFYGMMGLLVKHGVLGGMNGKGYGRVEFQLENFDADKAIKEYDDDMKNHRKDFENGIKLLAKHFSYKITKDKEDSKPKKDKKDKKGEK